MAYDDIIAAASKSSKIDPAVIKAIIKTESDWEPNATRYEKQLNESSYGLMQILLSTARDVTRNPALTPNQLLQPAVNILTGTKYLAGHLAKYNTDQAFSAYNAGRPLYSSLRPGKFVNQDYVDKVNRYWMMYRGGMVYTIPVVIAVGLGIWWFYSSSSSRRQS